MSLTSGGGSLRGRGVTSDFFYTETLRQTGGQNRNYRKEERNYKTQPKIRVGDSFFFFFFVSADLTKERAGRGGEKSRTRKVVREAEEEVHSGIREDGKDLGRSRGDSSYQASLTSH